MPYYIMQNERAKNVGQHFYSRTNVILLCFLSKNIIIDRNLLWGIIYLKKKYLQQHNGFFTKRFELVIFNVSVLADYG